MSCSLGACSSEINTDTASVEAPGLSSANGHCRAVLEVPDLTRVDFAYHFINSDEETL